MNESTFTYDIQTDNESFKFPVATGSVLTNCIIDFGDSTPPVYVDSNTSPALTHTYATLGQYNVTIKGLVEHIDHNASAHKTKLTDVVLTDLGFTLASNLFNGCSNLSNVDCSKVNVKYVTNM